MLLDNIQGNSRIKISNGFVMLYDASRSSWISATRENVGFGLNNHNISGGRYLKMVGDVYSNITGYKMLRPAIITGFSVQTRDIGYANFNIKKNKNTGNIYQYVLNGESGGSTNSLNISLDKDDYLQLYTEVTSGLISYPECLLEICWRES